MKDIGSRDLEKDMRDFLKKISADEQGLSEEDKQFLESIKSIVNLRFGKKECLDNGNVEEKSVEHKNGNNLNEKVSELDDEEQLEIIKRKILNIKNKVSVDEDSKLFEENNEHSRERTSPDINFVKGKGVDFNKIKITKNGLSGTIDIGIETDSEALTDSIKKAANDRVKNIAKKYGPVGEKLANTVNLDNTVDRVVRCIRQCVEEANRQVAKERQKQEKLDKETYKWLLLSIQSLENIYGRVKFDGDKIQNIELYNIIDRMLNENYTRTSRFKDISTLQLIKDSRKLSDD